MKNTNKPDDRVKSGLDNWKPGSEPEKAKTAGASGDFGAPESGRSNVDRDYVSRNTKLSDPGNAQPRSGDTEGARVSGVGGPNSGPGSSSGGDVDTDLVGVGADGSVVAGTPADEPPGPDDAQQYSRVDPARAGSKRADLPAVAEADVMQSAETSDDPLNRGADAVNSQSREDDSFAGEVSRGEASGDDNS